MGITGGGGRNPSACPRGPAPPSISLPPVPPLPLSVRGLPLPAQAPARYPGGGLCAAGALRAGDPPRDPTSPGKMETGHTWPLFCLESRFRFRFAIRDPPSANPRHKCAKPRQAPSPKSSVRVFDRRVHEGPLAPCGVPLRPRHYLVGVDSGVRQLEELLPPRLQVLHGWP